MKSLITFLVCLIACASIQAQQTVGVGDLELRVKTAEGMVLHGLTPINGRVIGFVNGAPGLITVSSGPINLATGVTGTLAEANGGTGATSLLGANIAVLNAANTFSVAGAASVPAMKLTGAVYTGGTGTTTMPHLMIEPAGTTAATSWDTGGNAIGVNMASGFAGYFLRFGVAGNLGYFSVHSSGNCVSAGGFTGLYHYFASGGGFYGIGDGVIRLTGNSGTTGTLQIGGTGTDSPAIKKNGTTLAVRLADDSADADVSARAVSHGGVTVANLPATPVAGMVAYVTDGSATPAWGDTVTGGGSTKILVWYNGTNWTAIGK